MTKRGKPVPGKPGIFDNGDGTYLIRVVAKKHGQRREKQETFTGPLNKAVLRQAELRLAGEAEIDKSIGTPEAARRTVSEAADLWLAHRRATAKGVKSTLDTFERHVGAFIKPHLGEKIVGELSPADINAWMRWLGEQKSKRRGAGGQGRELAREYLAGTWRTLRIFLKHACGEARIVSPADAVTFSVAGKAPRRKTWLTQAEVGRWITALEAEPPRLRALLGLLVSTGARLGEITALKREDFAGEGDVLRLVRAQSAGVVNDTTKGKRSRDVPLLPWVADAVRLWLRLAPPRADDLLFVSRGGKLLQSASIRVPMQRVRERAGLDRHVTPHDLRRTMGNLVRRNAGKTVAMSLLGHVTEAMHEHYSEVGADERLAAVEAALGAPRAVLAPIDLGEAT